MSDRGGTTLKTPDLLTSVTAANFTDFEALFAITPTPLMILDRNLCFAAMNQSYLAATERTREGLIGRYVFDAFPETGERLTIMKDAFERGVAGEASEQVRHLFAIAAPDGSYHDAWWTCHQVPVRDTSGTIVGVLQHMIDVTAEVVAERMRDAIGQEYDHRVRNILTKVSAIARRTARGSTTVKQFVDDFEPRISSMARAHQLLVHGGWESLGLAELLDSEMTPYASRSGGQITKTGENVRLSSRIAQALGMAFHELATNALKYGALSRPEGRLTVTWSVASDTGVLDLTWTETGLSGITRPLSSGFGSTIIDQILPTEIAGSVRRRFEPTGVVCTIQVPNPVKT